MLTRSTMTDNQSVLLVNSPICRLCLNVYQHPKILSCLHSFCHTCLEKLHTIQVVQSQLTCPVCDVDTDIPPGGISSLTNNAFLNRISQDYIEAVESTITRKSTENQYGASHLNKSKQFDRNKEKVNLPDELKKEVSVIFEKLQSELQHLQEEALRTTFSIEKVTDTVSNWKQQNSEIKIQIQRRSEALQHLIRRRETQMIAQLANQQYTDKFSQDIETAKCGLKQNLKNTIQAIEFIKQVQEFATDQDVLDMREFLMGQLAILNKVSVNYKQYFVDFQDANIAEIIDDDFGQLGSSQTHEVVFDPTHFGEVNKEQENQENTDEENMPKRLRFRRKMNKERRLTSVVDKNWRADEPNQPTANPLSDLRENLIQRRRNLLQEYVSFEKLDLGMFNIHQSLQKSEIKKKKRRYHSFGGRSTQSVAPPDAATLRQINEHIQITSEQTTDVKPTFLKQNIPVEHVITKDPPISMMERSNMASDKLLLEKERSLSTKGQTHAYGDLQPTTGKLNEATATAIKHKLEEIVKKSRSMLEDKPIEKPEDKPEEEEWTVVTEEVVVQQTPPPQSKVQNTMVWESNQTLVDSTQRSVDSTQRSVDSTQRTVDSTYRSVDSTQRTVDSTYRSMHSTHSSVDSTQRSMDSTYRSFDSTQRTVDSTYRSEDSTHRSVYSISKSEDSTKTKDEYDKAANIQLLNVGSELEQNDNTSDSEWTVTEEEISVPQPTTPKSPSQNTNKSFSTNLPIESSTHKSEMIQLGMKAQTQEVMYTSQSEWTVSEEEISVQHITQQTTNTMTHEPQRPVWNSRYKTVERATRDVQEETTHKPSVPEKSLPLLKTAPLAFPKSPAMDESSLGKADVKQASPGEWKITTEEVSIPSDALSRSSVMQEDRETRLKFLRNNWRKRKDVLRQTEGFVAPVEEKEKKMPSPAASPAESDNKTERFVQFQSNLGSTIRSVLNEEKANPKAEQHIETVINGSHSPNYSKPDRLDDVFLTHKTSSGTRLTKDRLHEYRQNMRQKTERWRVDSN